MIKYQVIDVFTQSSFEGNPVAVVLEADNLTSEEMQNIARWTNLSETTFVLPPKNPKADYQLRIFTPEKELPFAGHPTIGSAYAIRKTRREFGEKAKIFQECIAGLISIRCDLKDPEKLFLKLPATHFEKLNNEEIDKLQTCLGTNIKNKEASAVNVGPVWIVGEIQTPEALLEIQYDTQTCLELCKTFNAIGISLFAKYPDHRTIEMRSFAIPVGVREDPICGSGNGAVAAFRLEKGQLHPDESYTAKQGKAIQRNGEVFIRLNSKKEIFVGGYSKICVTGQLNLD
ncbi:PhzF family phenazine biosynthesis protein [Acetobacteraceae bacterium]|nr:PhzF family phenazine biosynthesis protein [Acetobacteraceae bacterium]